MRAANAGGGRGDAGDLRDEQRRMAGVRGCAEVSEFEWFVPTRLDGISTLLRLKLRDIDLSSHETCVINFTKCTFGEPLPMLLLGREINSLKAANPNVDFICRSRESKFRGYADHIGYFRYIGFDRGKQIGPAFG